MKIILFFLFLGVALLSSFWAGIYMALNAHAKKAGAPKLSDEYAGSFAYAFVVTITSAALVIFCSGVLW